MPRRTYERDAVSIEDADDLDLQVRDKREGWRAGSARARRRQRRYKNRLTRVLQADCSAGEEVDLAKESFPHDKRSKV